MWCSKQVKYETVSSNQCRIWNTVEKQCLFSLGLYESWLKRLTKHDSLFLLKLTILSSYNTRHIREKYSEFVFLKTTRCTKQLYSIFSIRFSHNLTIARLVPSVIRQSVYVCISLDWLIVQTSTLWPVTMQGSLRGSFLKLEFLSLDLHKDCF